MANAAAKKAAAAREAAASTYLPIVAALNLGYIFLRLFLQRDSLSIYNGLATITLLALSCISYKGILADHGNTLSRNGKGGANSEALAGGASLDLLGLVTAVQYGTIFVSEKLYWSLMLIPLWGGWKLYGTFFGSKGVASGFRPKNPEENNGGGVGAPEKTAADDAADEKRRKRAERRRQKWS